MAERIPIVEDCEVTERIATEVASWGNLAEVDRYDSENTHAFDALIELSRQHVGQSLVAAALVSARDGQVESSPYDFGPNIQNALDTANKVRDLQAFAQEKPDDVGLYIGENHLILYKFAEMKMAPYYIPNSSHHALLSIEAPLQSGLRQHGGKLSRHVESSDRHESGRRGGYQWFAPTFNEIRTGSRPSVTQKPAPVLTFGRESIAEYLSNQVFTESVYAGTNHRLSSLGYGMWLVRGEDPQLADQIDIVCESMGLVELWTEQYRKEVGAKAAHLLLSKVAPISWLQQADLTEPSWFNDEPSIYGNDPELYLESAYEQAKRIGLDVDGAELKNAIKTVFNLLVA